MKNSEQLLYILQKITWLERDKIISRLKSIELRSDDLIQFAACTGRLPDDDEAVFIRSCGIIVFCDLWNRGFMVKARHEEKRPVPIITQKAKF